jgi:hypothetical protein
MNPHSIAAAGQSFDLFATRFCMATPPPWQAMVFVANGASQVAWWGNSPALRFNQSTMKTAHFEPGQRVTITASKRPHHHRASAHAGIQIGRFAGPHDATKQPW